MNTVHSPGRAESSSPRRNRIRPRTTHILLWASAAVLVPAVLVTLALLSDGTLLRDAATLELTSMGDTSMQEAFTPRGPADDAFRQQKADAKIEQLPAQF